MMFIITNLFNVFRQLGIFPRETHKIGENVSIEEYSFYNYRFWSIFLIGIPIQVAILLWSNIARNNLENKRK